ncbi:MAG: hypothetical protein RMK89_14040, partial [Armatimonadota bacterium]|nr:hypothetical protein [Armatimonadota bacterium]MDW8144566.1 hypothetical protein [Armatimonadota bacterium]
METSRLHPDCDLTLAALHWANGGRVTRWYTPQGGVWLPDYFEPYSHDADPPPSPDVCPRFRGLYLFDRITSAII